MELIKIRTMMGSKTEDLALEKAWQDKIRQQKHAESHTKQSQKMKRAEKARINAVLTQQIIGSVLLIGIVILYWFGGYFITTLLGAFDFISFTMLLLVWPILLVILAVVLTVLATTSLKTIETMEVPKFVAVARFGAMVNRIGGILTLMVGILQVILTLFYGASTSILDILNIISIIMPWVVMVVTAISVAISIVAFTERK